jgi:hypothetical protein
VLHHVLVTDCLKANQGKNRKRTSATIIHHFNTYTNIKATKANPFPDGKQADILLSGITSIDNPTARRNWHLDVTSTNPMGVTNQELINRADLGHQPGPGEHDPRNDVLTSAKRAEERTHTKSTPSARQQGRSSHLSRSRRRARRRLCLRILEALSAEFLRDGANLGLERLNCGAPVRRDGRRPLRYARSEVRTCRPSRRRSAWRCSSPARQC